MSGHDHRERRVSDSARLQELITDLSKVRPTTRMYHVHDELMHAIERSLAQHPGHRFEHPEIDVIKDVAYQIVHVLDPSNRPARGFFAPVWREFKALSALGKLGAIAAVCTFFVTSIVGLVTIWDKVLRPSMSDAPAVSTQLPTPAQTGQPSAPGQTTPPPLPLPGLRPKP